MRITVAVLSSRGLLGPMKVSQVDFGRLTVIVGNIKRSSFLALTQTDKKYFHCFYGYVDRYQYGLALNYFRFVSRTQLPRKEKVKEILGFW
jgi:hypothetical protein